MEIRHHIIFLKSVFRIVMQSCLTLVTSHVAAQDFHLSQYDAPAMLLNPSMTGFFYGYFRLHGHYRTQWASIATKPFTTSQISYEKSIEPFGVGIQVMDNRAGAGNYNVFNFNISGAYDIALDFLKHHHLCLGMQTGFIQKSIDLSKLNFNNQYTTNAGFNSSLSNGETFSNTSIYLYDVSVGTTYYYDSHEGRQSDKSEIKFILGFAVFHVNQPKESFLSSANVLPRHYLINGQYQMALNEQIQMIPKFLYMQQANDKELDITLIFNYSLEKETNLIFGTTYRFQDAAVAHIGLKKGDFTYLISYDMNISSLSSTTYGRGGLETSLTYLPHQAKKKRSCPKFANPGLLGY